jgi:hypothetical protein
MASPERPWDAESLRARIAELESELVALRSELRDVSAAPIVPSEGQWAGTVPPRAPPVPSPTPSGRADRSDSLERFIGGRVIATIGGIVLTVGLGALVHLAYRQGWFASFGPLGRMAVGYVVSAAIIALGEVVSRRTGRLAAVGFVSAGVAGLYITTYLGTELGHVLSPVAALIAAAVIVVLGSLLTLRYQSLPIAIIALLGAFASPVFSDGFRSSPFFTAVHLSISLVAALSLAAFRPQPFWTLRFVALPLHGFLSLIWAFSEARREPELTVVFVILWWGLYLAEAGLAAMRGTTPRANVVIALLATLLASGYVAPVLAELVPWQSLLAYAPIGMALAAGAGSFLLPQVQMEDAHTDEERSLARSAWLYRSALRVIALLLGALALAPFLGAAALAVVWSAFALTVVEAERRDLVVAGRFLGVAVLTLALIAAFVAGVAWRGGVSWFALGANDLIVGLGELRVGPIVAAFAVVALAGATMARRLPENALRLAEAAAFIAAFAWFLGSATSAEDWMLVAMMSVAPSVLAFGRRGLQPMVAVLAATAAMVAWAVVKADSIPGSFLGRQGPSLYGIDILIAAVIVGASLVAAAGARSAATRIPTLVASFLLMTCAAGFIGLADIGSTVHASQEESVGIAAACIAVVALIVHLYAVGFGGRAMAVASVAQITFAGVLWAVAAVAVPALREVFEPATPFLHIGSVSALILVTCSLLAYRSEARSHDWPNQSGGHAFSARMLLIVACVEVVVYLSREIARVIAGIDPSLVAPGMSLLWGATAIGIIIIGFARRQPIARWIGLATLALIAIKVLAWDMRSTDTLLRVIIMLVVGTIMVVTSILYVRRSRAVAGGRETSGEGSSP